MKQIDLTLEDLPRIVHEHVRLVNESQDEPEPGLVQIQIHGKLERHEDNGFVEYYVRVGEDPQGAGSNGITFSTHNIRELFRAPSGIHTIVLKG